MTKKLLIAFLFICLLTFIACNSGDEGNTHFTPSNKNAKNVQSTEELFPIKVTNEGKPINGGVLQVALVKDEPFQGIFSPELYEDGFDASIMEFSSNAIFSVDGDFLITDEGIASLEVDEKRNKVKITIRKDVKWSDGNPLTIEDIIFPYKLIAHKDYTGVRYDTTFQNIVGVEEYHAGKTDTISGIKKINNKTVEIQFHVLSPAIFSGGDGLWAYAAPSHILKDIPVKKLIESDAIRKNPVTLGPFAFDKIVPGETVQFVKNKYYWKGEPKLDGVLVKVIPSSSISVAIGSGDFDIVKYFDATKLPEINKYDNMTILGRPEMYYSYMGYKLGKFDRTNKMVVTDLERSKVGNKYLRQALGYALDIEQVSEVFYSNLRKRANSLIPPVYSSFYDATLEGYYYDPKRAEKLLDDAGFVDVDGDGFREDPQGNKLELKLAAMAGDSIHEEIILYYLQNWKDIGINVTLTTDRLIEFNSFYDKIEADDEDIDIFMGAWGTGTNPSPAGLYGKSDAFNFSRYTSDFLETTIKNIDSKDAFDANFRASQFRAFQEYMQEEAPVIPMQFRYEIVPVNKRVKNYSIDYTDPIELHELELIAEKPLPAS